MPRRKPKPKADETAGSVRISAGALRGREIETPQTGGVRPMLSRTRMALFNVLGDDIRGATVWDCFAGSGLLGIEALSRGADFCVFIERDPAHARVVEGNLKALGLASRSRLIRGSVFDLVKAGAPPLPHTPADLLLLDPPHAMIEDRDGPFWPWLSGLHDSPLADAHTLACIGHPADLAMPETAGGFRVIERRAYGTVAFTILGPVA
ncbi:MAG: RsmD family RNA methyltransferase [Planctomycetes bacterium]|nr:RsmD family RNA methyltransferase [Planctomycetota bacterium]MCW8136353.1 RsmD family RNA methyltransferase [Planctomycetota bacterium]